MHEVYAAGGPDFDGVEVLDVAADQAAQPVTGEERAVPPVAVLDGCQDGADLLLLGWSGDGGEVRGGVQRPGTGGGVVGGVAAEHAFADLDVVGQPGLVFVADLPDQVADDLPGVAADVVDHQRGRAAQSLAPPAAPLAGGGRAVEGVGVADVAGDLLERVDLADRRRQERLTQTAGAVPAWQRVAGTRSSSSEAYPARLSCVLTSRVAA